MNPPYVVAGVDGTGNNLIAVDRAAEEAILRGWPLRLVHALDERHEPTEGFDLVRQAALRVNRRQPGVDVSTVVGVGSPPEVLAQHTDDCGLLVLGNRGRGELSGVRSSVALHLLPKLRIPLLVVRVPGLPALKGYPIRPVVVGVDGTPEAAAATVAAAQEALLRSAPLIAVHATAARREDLVPDPLWSAALADEDLLGGRVSRLHLNVDPRAALIALSRQACLVAIGGRGRRGLTGYLLGSVGQTLIHRAHCPVLITGPVAGALALQRPRAVAA